jgi:hypothetical protein
MPEARQNNSKLADKASQQDGENAGQEYDAQ